MEAIIEDPEPIVITCFEDLHLALKSTLGSGAVYRGDSGTHHGLVPHVGRSGNLLQAEAALFTEWKRQAVQFEPLPQDDWACLAIAQHYGLATRLLDWTSNPLVAAFFAVAGESVGDGTLWAFAADREVGDDAHDPLAFEGIALYRSRALATRIARQGAAFTIHGPPSEPVSSRYGKLQRFTLVETYRAKLMRELAFYGVSHASLFPGLDGLSRFLNWQALANQTKRLDASQTG